MSNKRKFLSILIVVSLGALLSSFFLLHQSGRTREEVVQAYVKALESKNATSMQNVILKTSTTEQLAKQKLQNIGGHQFSDIQVCYNEIKPQLTIVTITGNYVESGQKRSFSERVSLIYERGPFWKLYQGRWYLSLFK